MSLTLPPPKHSFARRAVPSSVAALPSRTLPSANGLRRLPGVVLFAAGTHTDMHGTTRAYGADYLSVVAKNFAALRHSPDPHVEPPAVLGHEVSQDRLAAMLADDAAYQAIASDRGPTPGGGPSRTDEPAAGWWENVRFDPDNGQLTADLERIPPTVADMIDRGELRFPSVEFKETLKYADGREVGPALFRVALLGGTPPACKSVPPLGHSHFADAPPGVVIFADGVVSMADTALRDALIQRLVIDPPPPTPEWLATLDDKTLSDYAALGTAAEEATEEAPADEAMADGDVPEGFDKAACINAIIAAEKPADETMRRGELELMTDAELYALEQTYASANTGVTPMSEKPAVKPAVAPKPAVLPADLRAQVKAFADQQIARLDAKEKAIDRKAAELQRRADTALATQKARDDAEWAQTVSAFCDSDAVKQRVSPAELDPTDPINLRVQLLSIPANDVIAFADAAGATVKKSRREVALEAIRKRPIRQFGDRIAAKADDPTRTAVKKYGDKLFARRKVRNAAAANART